MEGTPSLVFGSTPLRHFVVLGDSISEGIGDSVEGEPVLGVFDLIATRLHTVYPEMLYTNLAKRGLLIEEVRQRQLATAVALRPDLVSVIAGANDALKSQWDVERYEAHLDTMLKTFTELGTHIITATWPNFTLQLDLTQHQKERLVQRLQAGNAVTRRISRKYGTFFIEFWEHSIDLEPRLWSQDGVHPNTLGYREMAALALGVLDQESKGSLL